MQGLGDTTLVALCGLSPAVLTETVWCLQQEGTDVKEVIVLTTEMGKEAIRNDLFGPYGVWDHFVQTLGSDIIFQLSNYHVRLIPDATGHRDLADIATTEDNEACGDFFLSTLHEILEGADHSIVCSIAGGRKTMGTLLSLCLMLIGRPQDRLCHVLINPPFDHPGLEPPFYFPGSSDSHQLDGTRISNSDARPSLIDVPFIKAHPFTRTKVTKNRFMELVRTRQEELDRERLPNIEMTFDGTCRVDGVTIPLSASQHTLLLAELWACQMGTRPLGWLERGEWIEKIELFLADTGGRLSDDPDALKTMGNTLRKKLLAHLPPHLVEHLFPKLRDLTPPYPPHRLNLPPELLT